MKRFTLILTVILVMCFTMAFPASAAVDIVHDPIMLTRLEQADAIASQKLPAGYVYRYVYTGNSYNSTYVNNNFSIIYSNTPTISVGSTIYKCNIDSSVVPSAGTLFAFTTTNPTSFKVSSFSSSVDIYMSVSYSSGSSTYYTPFTTKGCYEEFSTAYLSGYASYKSTLLSKGIDIHYKYVPSVPPVDSSALQALLAQAKAKQNTGYTASTWQALQNQITAAQSLLNSTGYTQAQVDNAKNALQSALNGLVMLPDISELELLLVEADAVEDDGYTTNSWTRFTTARYSGHALVSRSDYTQVEVTDTTVELRSSMNSLIFETVIPPYEPPPISYGYDLESGDISGYLNPVPKIFYNYTVPVVPIAIGLFSILFSIKLIPYILDKIINILRR